MLRRWITSALEFARLLWGKREPPRDQARLPRETQMLLGAKLRSRYRTATETLPVRFIQLARRLRSEPARLPVFSAPDPVASGTPAGALDPDAIKILDAALESAWSTLQAIGNKRITRDQLAKRICELALRGERDPARLASNALTSLITRR